MNLDFTKINETDSSEILIVDDNPQNLQVLAKMLQDNNYNIEFATNGIAALDWLKDKSFDLVLLDINMPGLDGYQVCQEIKSDVDLKKIPVIFLSADVNRDSILKGFEIGGNDYVTKPFDSRELIIKVKTQIALKNSIEKIIKLQENMKGLSNQIAILKNELAQKNCS